MELKGIDKANFAKLKASIEASDRGFAYANAATAEKYEAMGLIESNPGIVDEKGRIAVRLKPENQVQSQNQTEQPADQQPAKKVIQVMQILTSDEGFTPIKRKGGRTGTSKYPFAQLEIGQSFFVSATEENPTPEKSLASTITAQNLKYSEPVEGETRINRKGVEVPVRKQIRKFEMQKGELHGVAGVRISRVEV